MKQFSFASIVCLLFLMSCSGVEQESTTTVNNPVDIQENTQISTDVSQDEDHEHNADTHTHEEEVPPIPVANFGEGDEGVEVVPSYASITTDMTVKLHGSLVNADGEQSENTSFSYGRSTSTGFENIDDSSSDEGGFYFIKFPIGYESGDKVAHVDMKIGDVISRVYLVPQGFNTQNFIDSQENLPDNFYFTTISLENNTIIAGVDIVVNPQ